METTKAQRAHRKEHPILFSTDMVQAILGARKTQTRRLVNPQPSPVTAHPDCYPWVGALSACDYSVIWITPKGDGGIYKDNDYNSPFRCHYGSPGDMLWVRESFFRVATKPFEPENKTVYKADGWKQKDGYIKWKPSIHMPKEYARIWLEITSLRCEQLKQISDADCVTEGIEYKHERDGVKWYKNYQMENAFSSLARGSFRSLWDKTYYSRGFGWEVNPFVWVVSFKVLSVTGKPDLSNLTKRQGMAKGVLCW